MDKMSELLDELADITADVVDLDVKLLDKKIDKMMPELGFSKEDNDRLVSFTHRSSPAVVDDTIL